MRAFRMISMKPALISALMCLALSHAALAEVRIDVDALGKNLGGWTKRSKQAAEYPLSGASYRTYRPEVTPTPDGGIFVSVRIDHVRGWLASDDHAMLEITIDSKGAVASAQSNIAIQGRTISSDLIRGGTAAGKQVHPVEGAVQISTDLVADISEKLLREKIVEAGRVSFPAALRHNFNLLCQSIRVEKKPEPASPPPAPAPPATPAAPVPPPAGPPLQITPYTTPSAPKLGG
jgi:hypothetical protein